ncbi:hypothetical protein IWX49DRAFT_350558 [Phyllosticta citricarpa]|uniref:Uncharacterized protein n=1 Tax=Phyllosticta citricarpa TaxID=55181 RepID=A0ABR1LS14_9PEZI
MLLRVRRVLCTLSNVPSIPQHQRPTSCLYSLSVQSGAAATRDIGSAIVHYRFVVIATDTLPRCFIAGFSSQNLSVTLTCRKNKLSSTSRCNQMDSPWRQESELSSDEDSFEALAPSAAERDKQTRWLLIARGGWSDEMHMTCPGSIDCRPLQALEMSIPRHACPGVPRRWRSPFNESRHAAALPVLLNVTESLQLNGLAAAWSINLSSRFGVKTRGWPHSSQTARAVRRPNISATPVLFSVEAWRHTISRPRQELAR